MIVYFKDGKSILYDYCHNVTWSDNTLYVDYFNKSIEQDDLDTWEKEKVVQILISNRKEGR